MTNVCPTGIILALDLGNSGNFWTSGQRPQGGGVNMFTWTDSGETMVYKNFMSGEPSGGSDCVILKMGAGWKWNDGTCSLSFRAICKLDVS